MSPRNSLRRFPAARPSGLAWPRPWSVPPHSSLPMSPPPTFAGPRRIDAGGAHRRHARRRSSGQLAVALAHERSAPDDGSRDDGSRTVMFVLAWITGLLRHRAVRLAGTVIGVAMTVALLGSLGAFFAASKAQMTRQATAGVMVDWQVQLAPGASQASAGHIISGAPGVTRSLPVSYGNTTGLSANVGGTTQVTGSGQVVGLPPGYSSAFPAEIRHLTQALPAALLPHPPA